MKKLEFTDEIDSIIIESFNLGLTQNEIRTLLKTDYNFSVGSDSLSKHFKVLGINGNEKVRKDKVNPWYKDMFTTDSFPDKLQNCIIFDLSNNSTYEYISHKRGVSVSKLKQIFNPENLTEELKKEFRAYRYIYSCTDTTDFRNYNDEDKKYIVDKVNDRLNGKAKLEMNHVIDVCGKGCIFDLYCHEANQLLISCPGTWHTQASFMRKIHYNTFHVDYPHGEEERNNLNDYIANTIYERIINELNGVEWKPKRDKSYIAPPKEIIEIKEDNDLLQKTECNNMEELTLNFLVDYYNKK